MRRTTYMDVVTAFLHNRSEGLQRLSPRPSFRSAKRAEQWMRLNNMGEIADELVLAANLNRKPGVIPPEPGMVRAYKMQVQHGGLFLRLPIIRAWGHKPGKTLAATFHENHIVIARTVNHIIKTEDELEDLI